MTAEENSISALLSDLYGGVNSESLWLASLNRISETFRGSAVFFGSLEANGSSAMVGHGIDPTCAALIGGPLATRDANPFIAPMMTMPIGKAVPTELLCGDAALVGSTLFDQALRPHGQRYAIGAMLELNGGTAKTVGLTREGREGDYRGDEVNLLDRLLPHLTRALQLRETFGTLSSQFDAAYSILETLDRGILILSSPSEIAFVNAEARRIFAQADGIGATSAGVVIGDRQASDQVRKAILTAAIEARDKPLGSASICVPRPSGKLPLALSVAPAPGLSNQSTLLVRPLVILTIVDPERQSCPSQQLLRQIYGLTPVETKLAAALCRLDLKHSASELGISVNTAKTHLQAIFQKVGVSRQAALVRLITLHMENR